MSLTIAIKVQYNNNKTGIVAGLHSSKGLDYTSQTELVQWARQFQDDNQDAYTDKKLKRVWVEVHGSYTKSDRDNIWIVRGAESIGHAMLDVNNIFNTELWEAV